MNPCNYIESRQDFVKLPVSVGAPLVCALRGLFMSFDLDAPALNNYTIVVARPLRFLQM